MPIKVDANRKRLLKRARNEIIFTGQRPGALPDSYKITPSERKSKALKKKLENRKSNATHFNIPATTDCRDCPDKPSCTSTLEHCHHQGRSQRCAKCGVLVMYRYIPDDPWEYCPPCKAMKPSRQ